VQKYHLYWVIQAFYSPFFDVFSTSGLNYWKPAFWKWKFFLRPTRFEGEGGFNEAVWTVVAKSNLLQEHYRRSNKAAQLQPSNCILSQMFPKKAILKKTEWLYEICPRPFKVESTPNQKPKTDSSDSLKESKSLNSRQPTPVNTKIALHCRYKSMLHWLFI
jgi:hypothetical protein